MTDDALLTALRKGPEWYCNAAADEITRLRNIEAEVSTPALWQKWCDTHAVECISALTLDLDQQKRLTESNWILAESSNARATKAEAERDALRKLLLLAKDELGDWDYEPREQHNHWCSHCDRSIDGNREIRDAIDAACREQKP